MGSIGGKTPTEPKLYSSSLTLGILSKKIMLIFVCFAQF
jgi:hypothetical protein